jgi:GTP-binding protein EngB required for normal cell division
VYINFWLVQFERLGIIIENGEFKMPKINTSLTEFNHLRLGALFGSHFNKVESATGKNIVLFIGATGAGKSTTINYLMGCKMIRGSQPRQKRRILVDEEHGPKAYAIIGHNKTAQTLYPEAYTNAEGLTLCDCPGFEGNRTPEERVFESVTTEYVVKSAQQINGVIVVLDYNALEGANRGACFIDLLRTLHRLFHDVDDLMDSILFLVTKCPPNLDLSETQDEIQSHIEEFIQHHEEKLQLYGGGIAGVKGAPKKHLLKTEEERAAVKELDLSLEFLQILLRQCQAGRVIPLNPLENSGRKVVLPLISRLNPLSPDVFNFSEYDETRVKFDAYITELCYFASLNLRAINSLPAQIEQLKHEVNSAANGIAFATQQISQLTTNTSLNVATQHMQIKAQIDALNQRLNSNENEIAVTENKKQSLERQLVGHDEAKLKKERFDLSQSDPALYKETVFTEKRGRLGFFARSNTTLIYADAIPFVKIEKSCSPGGVFENETPTLDNQGFPTQASGTKSYTVKYRSTRGEDGNAKIQAYVAKKDIPANKARVSLIEKLLVEIAQMKIDIGQMSDKLNELTLENKQHNQTILNLENNKLQSEREKQSQILNYKNSKEALELKIKVFSDRIKELQAQVKEAKAQVNLNVQWYKLACKIATTVKITNPVIMDCLSLLDDFQSAKAANVSNLTSHAPKEFFDIITRKIMVDPVITQCGHNYERETICTRLDQAGESNSCCAYPSCGMKITKADLRANSDLRGRIEDWQLRKANVVIPGLMGQSKNNQLILQNKLKDIEGEIQKLEFQLKSLKQEKEGIMYRLQRKDLFRSNEEPKDSHEDLQAPEIPPHIFNMMKQQFEQKGTQGIEEIKNYVEKHPEMLPTNPNVLPSFHAMIRNPSSFFSSPVVPSVDNESKIKRKVVKIDSIIYHLERQGTMLTPDALEMIKQELEQGGDEVMQEFKRYVEKHQEKLSKNPAILEYFYVLLNEPIAFDSKTKQKHR